MAAPEPGEGGNPFQSLLGDLMNMLGTNAPNQWEMTRSFALNVATGGAPEANVEPIQRIRLEELARVAELNVTEVTGLPVSPDGRRLTCIPVGRGDWTLRALDSWRGVLTAMTPVPGPAPPPSEATDPTAIDPFAGDDPMGGLGSLLGQWANAIGPMLFGLQVGSVVGHLSHRALGQYPLPLPWSPSDELLVVTTNVTAFAEDWSLPEEEALLWVCARELAANSVLTRHSVRGRLEELLVELARSAASVQQDLTGRLGALGSDGSGMDLES